MNRAALEGALRWAWRELRIGIPLCVAAAGFFSAMLREPFGHTLVHSFCIGLSAQLLIEAGRYGFARRLRQRIPDDPQARADWPGWPGWPGWRVMAPWIVVSATVAYLLGTALAGALTGERHVRGAGDADVRTVVRVAGATMLLSLAIVYVFYARGRIAAIEAQAEAARRTATDARLKLIESQLEPHMLFNTLANLRVLIGTDPPRAQAMLDHLIGFLRATLGASRASRHPLADEFARIADYLELMRVRMGARLATRLDLPAGLAAHPVPPLLLQPLVENAIVHGLEPQVGPGRIVVAASRDGGRLVLDVRDTGIGPGADPGTGPKNGFGLRQVRERLHAVYGDAASLDLAPAGDAEGGTRATIRLPLEPTG